MIRCICCTFLLVLWAGHAIAHGGGAIVSVYAIAETVPGARTSDYANIHTVAVISAIGQSLTVQKAGLLMPEKASLDIRSWALDDQVVSLVRQYLGSRFVFRDVPADRGALAQVPNGVWNYSTPALRNILKALPVDGIDAFIVVRPDLEPNTPGLAGVALDMGTDILTRDLPPIAWANYEIDIVDAHSLSIIAKAYSRIRTRSSAPPSFSGIRLDGTVRPVNGVTLSDKQFSLLHEVYSDLINVSVLETVRALNTGAELPPVGARSLAALPPDKDPFAGIKSVAVASALGNQLHFDHLGGTILSQSHEDLAVPDWKLDDQIEKKARATLAERFQIRDVAIDRSALHQAQILNSDGKLAPSFPGLTQANDVDAYVLIIPLAIKRWNTDESGFGVWNHTPLLDVPNSNAVYANYAVAVLDAHSLKLVSIRSGAVGPDYPTSEVLREIDPAAWPAHVSTATPAQLDLIDAGLVKLLDDSVPETLLHMGLTGKIISTAPDNAAQSAASR